MMYRELTAIMPGGGAFPCVKTHYKGKSQMSREAF
jgi:hypothetical protein